MIDLYTWTTPNGRKVSILLEELGVEYTAHSINIGQGDQMKSIAIEGDVDALLASQSERVADWNRALDG